MSTEAKTRPMPFSHLEAVYEALAVAIDQAGEEKRDIYLAKLVLKLASDIGDKERVLAAIKTCLVDI